MKIEETIKELILEPITNQGYLLDEVIYEKEGSTYFLRVIIDKEPNVDIEDCVIISKIINPILDEKDVIKDNYILDVCSKEKGR